MARSPVTECLRALEESGIMRNKVMGMLEYFRMINNGAINLYKKRSDSLIDERTDEISIDDTEYGLEASVRNQLELAFGVDLSDVRIHTGDMANDLTEHHNAEAVTIGTHIFFSSGSFSPDTEEGIKLLAHEITHVIDTKSINGRMAKEDIEGLEQRAEKVEEEISGIRLHHVNNPVFSNEEATRSMQVSSNETNHEALRKAVGESGNGGSLDDFREEDRTLKYAITLSNGQLIKMSALEFQLGVKKSVESIEEWIKESKCSMTNSDYEDLLLKYLTWLDIGHV